MKNATFYLLDNDATVDGLSAVEQLVCDIAAERWRNGKRVLIACEDEQQAIRLDEALWSRPPESFVPHNLAGEGPRGGAPVEIAWPQKRNSSPRDILISLRLNFADFATAFTEVIDFVPYEDNLKQLARERYKAYRMAGFNLNTATWKKWKRHTTHKISNSRFTSTGKSRAISNRMVMKARRASAS